MVVKMMVDRSQGIEKERGGGVEVGVLGWRRSSLYDLQKMGAVVGLALHFLQAQGLVGMREWIAGLHLQVLQLSRKI